MTTVYVVTQWFRYDGDQLLGIFSSYKNAEEYVKTLVPPRYSEVYKAFADGYDIEEWNVDNEEPSGTS